MPSFLKEKEDRKCCVELSSRNVIALCTLFEKLQIGFFNEWKSELYIIFYKKKESFYLCKGIRVYDKLNIWRNSF